MTTTAAHDLEAFMWERQPQAERFVRELVDEFLARNSQAAELARRMKQDTGTRLIDWVETIFLSDSPSIREKIAAVGYVRFRDRDGEYAHVYTQPHGIFPRIAVHQQPSSALHLKVDSVADFTAVWQVRETIQGPPVSPYRRVRAFVENQTELWAAERWGWVGFNLPPDDSGRSIAMLKALDDFRTRHRDFDEDAKGFSHAEKLITACPLSIDLKCALFFQAEREFWTCRNRAAQVQKARQDRLGLGWANHDHHTYRSSRENFTKLVAIWEKLGFHCRERFYAGREAGWGAQVMEHPAAGIVTFNDVDLSPEELMNDFAHEPLAPQDRLGTVGLWCGLHGDSFLQAGMHHLECQFDFDALKQQLETQDGVKVMKPFTDFPYLRQAFTEGERWKVRPERIERLLNAGLIDENQARQFREQGAIGSHLENLERNEGFKGFNQSGVSEIIRDTDPRRHLATQPV